MPETVLIVDDDKGIRYSLKRFLEEKGLQVITARNAQEALEAIDKEIKPEVALIDIVMPGVSGLDLLEVIKEKDPRLLVIMATAHGTTERAIRAMKLGAYDYILKPYDISKMWETMQKALQVAKSVRKVVTFPPYKEIDLSGESIIGDSPKMQEIYKTIGQVAAKDVNVLIIGESGTGKELVARAIYQYSQRHNYPFLSINCAAIPENLLESELFGHEKGAFTGAEFKRIGRFEQAHRGTIFLDEIGDMPTHIQAKILRVLQEKEIQKLGSSETVKVDVRLIAATNKNIEEGVKEGWFREDLYYRLNVITIALPPLRERKEDIPKLIRYFLSHFSQDMQKEIAGVTEGAMSIIMKYPWPGNVRELENTLKRAVILCKSNEISAENLPPQIRCGEALEVQVQKEMYETIDYILDQLFALLIEIHKDIPRLDLMSIIERGMIERAIRFTTGNKLQAAALLGINRNTLRNKMERFGIDEEE